MLPITNQIAHNSLVKCHKEIQDFHISFADKESIQSIDAHQQYLLSQLGGLLLNSKSDLPEDMIASLGKTQQAIREAALNQKIKLMQNAEACVTLYLSKINDFSVFFVERSSEEAIKKKTVELRMELNAIINQAELQKALELIPAAKESVREAQLAKEDIIHLLSLTGAGFTSYATTQRFRLFTMPTDATGGLQESFSQMGIRAGG